MKKIFLAALMSGLLIFQSPQAKAHGWGIAAGVLGGLAVGTAIGASYAQPVYYAPGPSYYSYPYSYSYGAPVTYAAPAYQAPAVVYAPTPGVVYGGPVVSVGFGGYRPYGYYGHGYYRGYYRGRW